jgi:hypothetical protein
MRVVIVFLFLLTQSCTFNHELKPIDLTYLFNDSSSKIWLVDKVLLGENDFSAEKTVDKDVLLFFDSQVCMFQTLKLLGNQPARSGIFNVDSGRRLLTISFEDSTVWFFRIRAFSKKQLTLIPLRNSAFHYKLVLIPLPVF